MADKLSQISLQEIRHVSSPLLRDGSLTLEDGNNGINGGGGTGYQHRSVSALTGSPTGANDNSWRREGAADKACNHLALAVLGFLALCSLCAIIGGGALLNSIAGFPFAHCPLLYGVGAGSVAAGCVFLALSLLVGYRLIKTKELSLYGACLFPAEQGTGRKLFRIVATGVLPTIAFLITLGLTIGSIALFTLSITVAPLSTDYKSVPGISGPIILSRDGAGLTHISANSRADALFGQGFAQAQDRLWQIEFQRLAGFGRLAEFVGDAALKFDKQTRALNMVNAANLLCVSITDEQRALAQSFVDGINYYLNTVNERPPEFLFMSTRLLFFHEPEPFTVLDVCMAARLLQWQLSFNVNMEIERFKMFWNTDRSYDEIEEMYVNMTNISHTIFNAAQLDLTEEDAVAARAREAEDHAVERVLYNEYMVNLRNTMGGGSANAQARRAAAAAEPKRQQGHFEWLYDMDFLKWKAQHASNAWAGRAAGPSSTTKACGASDPHLDINIPSVWYYSHLTYPDSNNVTFDTSGVGMLAIPGCHIAKTTYVAWGITMSLTDLEDLFLLVPDPANLDTHYIVNGTSYAFTPRTEVIKVRGSDDVTLQLQDSLYGPVVTEALKLPDGLKFAVWAKPLREDNTSITGVFNLGDPDIVRNVRDLRDKGFGQLQSPGFSIPMQDAEGNVGYTMTGWHVLRARGHTGKYPTLGNGSFDLRAPIPFDQLPTIIMNASTLSPASYQPFMMSAANQKTYPDGYRYTLGYDFVYPYRGGRIQYLLSQNTDQLSSYDFHRTVQTDIHSNVWEDMQAVMAVNAEFLSLVSADANGNAWWQALTTAWDGRSSKGSGYPSFFFLWIRELASVPKDVITALDLNGYWNPTYLYPRMLLQAPTATMTTQCGALTSPAGGSCAAFAAQSFNRLAAQYAGGEASAPRWGSDLNNLAATNLMMHGTIMQCLFERTVNKDGDYSTIDVSDFGSDLSGDITPNAASSMRQLYDWSTPKNISFVFPGGDSGNPYSDRYQNLLELFGDDGYVQVTVEGALPEAEATWARQTLTP
ncbi:penicillin amidase, putative [Bodo saltans]|uniref:Penicillin amidase, putative n=1 Tax=Bodo saltans TaxID=75058 RepID=A0A0S4JB64_BODSA|nr:penicillin amidase, putative [Bodo saltans]|eukprot:CUG87599.1 penicillin amidase, putative [Bodo saltans]